MHFDIRRQIRGTRLETQDHRNNREEFIDIELSCSSANGKLIAYLHEHARILSSRFDEQRATFRLLMEDKFVNKLRILDDGLQIKETAERSI